jgi:glycosyltransferase involved in cell wall biosynthesis
MASILKIMKISIVFPIHNEYENLNILLKDWDTKLKLVDNISYEFVLVEDGSTDGTKDLIKRLEKKYPIKNLSADIKRGYTKAVLDGIDSSNGDYILCTDSDNQIKVDSLIENIKNLPAENNFLIGFRNPRKDPLNRIIYSKLFKVLHDILFNSKLKDPSCPFVIGRRSDFGKLSRNHLTQMREGFWWGFVATCKKMNINLYEVPIQHFAREKGEAGYSLTKLPGIIVRNILGLFRVKFS